MIVDTCLFSSFAFHGANDEKSGFGLTVPRVANAPAFLPGATIGRPSRALFWRLREGLDSPEGKPVGGEIFRISGFGFLSDFVVRISDLCGPAANGD